MHERRGVRGVRARAHVGAQPRGGRAGAGAAGAGEGRGAAARRERAPDGGAAARAVGERGAPTAREARGAERRRPAGQGATARGAQGRSAGGVGPWAGARPGVAQRGADSRGAGPVGDVPAALEGPSAERGPIGAGAGGTGRARRSGRHPAPAIKAPDAVARQLGPRRRCGTPGRGTISTHWGREDGYVRGRTGQAVGAPGEKRAGPVASG